MTPPPAGRHVEAIEPNSAGGKAAAEALSRVLAEIQVAVWQRKAAGQTAERGAA